MDNELTQNELSIEDQSIEEQLKKENIKTIKKLDYSLSTPQERAALVKQIIDETPKKQLTNKYLELLSDYIIFAMDKQEKRNKKIITDNRMVTINKRETSFEGLAGKFENGEDGVYNIMTDNKNVLLTPKISITEKDLKEIPELKQLRDAIETVEAIEKKSVGRKKFLLKKQLIEMRQDQYAIKNAYRKPIFCTNLTKSDNTIPFDEEVYIDDEGHVHSTGLISFYEPSHLSALLCNYSKLKEDSWGDFSNDIWYIMQDLDDLIEKTLKDKYPLYYDLLIYKIDGLQNTEIQERLYKDYNIKHSVEYLSCLWRNKIPKLLAKQAEEDYLIWYYTNKEQGKWKRCSRCGQIKLANNRFFSKNNTSKDGFYSICKACRNAKTSKKKMQIIKKEDE